VARQSKDVPSAATIPGPMEPQLRACLEDIYRHLRGSKLVTAGKSGKREFRVVVDDDSRMTFEVWSDSEWTTLATLDVDGRYRAIPVLTSSDGTEFAVEVSNAGVLSTTAV